MIASRTVALAGLCFVLVACDIPPARGLEGGPVVLGLCVADPSCPGEGPVGRRPLFVAAFDRLVYPRDVHRGHVRVQSGTRSAFLTSWFEPVTRVLYAQSLRAPLEPNTRYRFWVEGIRDLDLHPMAERAEVTFETGALAEGWRPPIGCDYASVQPILDGCATSTCHDSATATVGLDLSGAAGIEGTAVGVPAEQSRAGAQGRGLLHGAPTLQGLARIDVVGGVGRPARSYLIYRLIDAAPGGAHALDERDQVRLSRWIRCGAPTE